MKILFLTIGDETVASSRARVYGYLPFLTGKNIKYKILVFTSKSKCRRILNQERDSSLQFIFEIFYKICILTMLFALSKSFDIIFVQKVILPKIIWKGLKRFNKKIIFDFDDAIYLYRDITYLVKDARGVIVSNKDLKRFASPYNKNVYELISPVKVESQHIPIKDKVVTLGWIGSPQTSKYLYSLIPVFTNLKEKFPDLNIEFIGVGQNKYFESLGIEIRKWSIDKEKEYLEDIDIGIMPLDDDEWSRSKAGYKLLLYMAMGIPCVASPVGINSEIIVDSINGYLANTPQEWLEKLSLLIENSALRQRLGREGQRLTNGRYSYKVNSDRFIDILAGIVGKNP